MATNFRWEMPTNGIKHCPFVDTLEREENELKAAKEQLKQLEAKTRKAKAQ